MDIKNILASAATMLFLAGSQGNHVLENYKPLIQDVLKNAQAPLGQSTDFVGSPIAGLHDVINWQLSNGSYDKDVFLQQVKLKLVQDDHTYKAIEMGVASFDNEVKAIQQVRSIKYTLESEIDRVKFVKSLDNARFKLSLAPLGSQEEREILDLIHSGAEKLRGGFQGGAKKHLVRSIDLTNLDQVEENIQDALEVYSSKGILKYGLQGLNDLFGANQGSRRGETIVIGALQHKWKSGMLTSMAVQAAFFNEPTFLRLPEPAEGVEDTRKALILHITLENDALGDLLWTYKYIREQITGEHTKIVNLTPEEAKAAAAYVHDFFSKRGFNFVIRQYKAGEFGYSDLFNVVEEYEELGYEIHHLTLDYMGKMSTRGCQDGPHGKSIQDLYQRVQNFMLVKKITYVTAHQLSTQAKELERMGNGVLVKEVCELGYYAGCKTVDNEVDMEIYQHKVIVGGRHYLMWQRGKHRSPNNITGEDLKFCVYEMLPIATIPWDYDREPRYSRKAPGVHNSEISEDMF